MKISATILTSGVGVDLESDPYAVLHPAIVVELPRCFV